jgi:hypothetical protein
MSVERYRYPAAEAARLKALSEILGLPEADIEILESESVAFQSLIKLFDNTPTKEDFNILLKQWEEAKLVTLIDLRNLLNKLNEKVDVKDLRGFTQAFKKEMINDIFGMSDTACTLSNELTNEGSHDEPEIIRSQTKYVNDLIRVVIESSILGIEKVAQPVINLLNVLDLKLQPVFFHQPIPVVTTDATQSNDYDKYIFASSGNQIFNLLPAALMKHKKVWMSNDNDSFSVTIIPDDPAETTNGATGMILASRYDSATLYSDGAVWRSI